MPVYVVCILNEVTLLGVIILPTRTIDYLNKNASTRPEKPPFELLVREAQETPETTQAIAVALGCPPGVECKFLFEKKNHHGL